MKVYEALLECHWQGKEAYKKTIHTVWLQQPMTLSSRSDPLAVGDATFYMAI
jgi:hypothetical protein